MKPAKKQKVKQKPAFYDKTSIIVLVAAAAVFLLTLLWIHSEDIFHGEGKIFWPYGDEIVEFERGTVLEVLSDDMQLDEVEKDAYRGSQKLSVKVGSGQYKGETMSVDNFFGPNYGVPLSPGDGVALTIKTHEDGEHIATVYEYNRIPVLAVFLILFCLVIAVIGGKTGVKSLIGLFFTVVCLFSVLIPLLFKDAPTVLTTFVVCAFIALVSFTILGGVHRKTISAFLGTVAGMFLAMVFGLVVQKLAKIDGLRIEDAEPLLQLKYAGATIRLKGLLVASIIISALGAVMDVAMSISSALEEVHAANPALKQQDLFKSGMNIGRDMVGTMTNTLILAFLGCEFTLILFLYTREMTFYHLYSTAFVAIETISGLASSLGMILAIPLTALISSTLITQKKKKS